MASLIGLGAKTPSIALYLGKTPPLDHYQHQTHVRPVTDNELLDIGHLTGNHWRKIINCYAKLAYELDNKHHSFKRWQNYRDQEFLRGDASKNDYALMFSEPVVLPDSNVVMLLAGKGYATEWAERNTIDLVWLTPDFAVNKQHNIIATPYFDYRQLSNVKITELVGLIQSLRD